MSGSDQVLGEADTPTVPLPSTRPVWAKRRMYTVRIYRDPELGRFLVATRPLSYRAELAGPWRDTLAGALKALALDESLWERIDRSRLSEDDPWSLEFAARMERLGTTDIVAKLHWEEDGAWLVIADARCAREPNEATMQYAAGTAWDALMQHMRSRMAHYKLEIAPLGSEQPQPNQANDLPACRG
jgi:hypothetical protein